MHTGTLPAASNRATYRETFEVVDDDTDELFDLTDATIVFEIRRRGDGSPMLSASTDDGSITVPSTGVFEVLFARDEMADLCAGTYDVGCTIERDDETTQFIAAQLPIIDGVVTP